MPAVYAFKSTRRVPVASCRIAIGIKGIHVTEKTTVNDSSYPTRHFCVKTFVKRVDSILTHAGKWTAALPSFLTRLVIGYAFYLTGNGKLNNLENVTKFFTNLGIPAPHLNAVFIGSLEYIGGMLLIVGLCTRPIAALFGATMVVALMTADNQALMGALRGVDDKGLTDVVPVVFGLFLLWLLMYGPGFLSIDWIIRKQFERLGFVSPRSTNA